MAQMRVHVRPQPVRSFDLVSCRRPADRAPAGPCHRQKLIDLVRLKDQEATTADVTTCAGPVFPVRAGSNLRRLPRANLDRAIIDPDGQPMPDRDPAARIAYDLSGKVTTGDRQLFSKKASCLEPRSVPAIKWLRFLSGWPG